MKQYWPDVYRSLGVKPVINAQSWVTALGGSLMRPEILRSMEEASTVFVDMVQLNKAAGDVVARACSAEKGLVTAGCSAAQVLMVAACMTGSDEEKVEQLPDSSGMKNEVVIFSGHRNRYDGAFKIPGAKLVPYGTDVDVTAEQLGRAININTCAIAFVIAPALSNGIGLQETVEIAHGRDVPVILDAAAEVPPRANLTRFIELGVDMVAFSGGKGIGGPQSTGLLAGRSDLIEAAFINSLNLHSDKAGIGRPMKVSKENIIGLVTALQLFLEGDEQSEYQGWRNKADYVASKLENIPGLEVLIEDTPVHRQGPQPVIYFDEKWEGPSTSEIRRRLLGGDPPIHVGVSGSKSDEINIVMVNVLDGEEKLIAERLLEAITEQ